MAQKYNAAERAFHQDDPRGYKGEAVREYQKEVHRKIDTFGKDNISKTVGQRQYTDYETATRMMAAGYSPKETAKAISKASPEAARLTSGREKVLYGRQIVANSLGTESHRKLISEMQRWKAESKIPATERRLDKIGGLATQYNRTPERSR